MTETDWRHCAITERQTGSTSVIIERLETPCDNREIKLETRCDDRDRLETLCDYRETNWRQGVTTETDWRHFVITERQTGSTSVIIETGDTL